MLYMFVRHSKNVPLADEVNLMDINHSYAHIHYPDGRESTVSEKKLSACPTHIIAVDRDTTSPLLTNMRNDKLQTIKTPTQSSANYMNYETSENPVS